MSCSFGFDNTGVGGWCVTHMSWSCKDVIPKYAEKTDEELAKMSREALIQAYKDLLAHHVVETTELYKNKKTP